MFVEYKNGKKGVLGHGAKKLIHIEYRDSAEMEFFKCSHVSYTHIDYTNGATVKYAVFIMFALGCVMFFPWFYCCLPCCMKDLKDFQHRCIKCKTHIATQDRCAVIV